MPASLTYHMTTAATGVVVLSYFRDVASRWVASSPSACLPQSSNGSYAIFSTLLASLFLALGTLEETQHNLEHDQKRRIFQIFYFTASETSIMHQLH